MEVQPVSAEECFAFPVTAGINSQTQYFPKAERQRFSCCCQHTRAVPTQTLLRSVRMGSAEELVIKQPILHSSPLLTILRNFSAFCPATPLPGEKKSPKNCVILHRGSKRSSQNKARPLCFPLFGSTLFLKNTFGEVYMLLDIQLPFLA